MFKKSVLSPLSFYFQVIYLFYTVSKNSLATITQIFRKPRVSQDLGIGSIQYHTFLYC